MTSRLLIGENFVQPSRLLGTSETITLIDLFQNLYLNFGNFWVQLFFYEIFFLYFDWFWRENRFGNWLCNIAQLRITYTHKTQVLNTSLDCTELDLTDLKVTQLCNEKLSKRVREVEL